jgi:hypothetical protein
MSDYEAKQGPKGEYLNIKFQVVEGDFKNRCFFDRYFLNGGDVAKRIANSKIASIGVAFGVEMVKNLDQICNKPFTCKVGHEEGTNGYQAKNTFVSAKAKVKTEAKKPEAPKPAAPGIDAFEDDDLV